MHNCYYSHLYIMEVEEDNVSEGEWRKSYLFMTLLHILWFYSVELYAIVYLNSKVLYYLQSSCKISTAITRRQNKNLSSLAHTVVYVSAPPSLHTLRFLTQCFPILASFEFPSVYSTGSRPVSTQFFGLLQLGLEQRIQFGADVAVGWTIKHHHRWMNTNMNF